MKFSRPLRFARALPLVAVLLGGAGCAPRDPLERTISAPTPSRFATWRSHLASDANADTVRRAEAALQEIRLSITGERELKRQLGERVVGGTQEIDEAVRQRVDGRPLREVLQLGYELRVRRLEEELAGLEAAMRQNERLVTRPGDLESEHHLEGLRDRQQMRVATYREQISAAERELGPLRARTGRRLIDAPFGAADEVPVTKRR